MGYPVGNGVWQAEQAGQLGTLQIAKTIRSHQEGLYIHISELFEDSLMNLIRPHRCVGIQLEQQILYKVRVN